MFFRGKGTVKAKEEHAYHPDVVVLFQSKAWADQPTVVEWVDKCLKPWQEEALGFLFLLILTRFPFILRRFPLILRSSVLKGFP
jgi:hypothetical protein